MTPRSCLTRPRFQLAATVGAGRRFRIVATPKHAPPRLSR
jgi:hypothetical protein